MAALIREGWEIFFYAPLFGKQRRELKENVQRLKARLSDKEYSQHPDVKLLANLMKGIKEVIVLDPFQSNFALTDDLKYYGRLKRNGLPDRYRLFFRAFQEGNRKVLVIIWLGYPRKEGAKDDCYAVFEKLVLSKKIPSTMSELIRDSEG